MKKRIILTDDEELLLEGLAGILEKAGYMVETAKDGKEALDKIIESRDKNVLFDLMIVDIRMPNLTGIELLDELKSENISIPSIAITGFRDTANMKELVLKGCDAYLLKPFEPEKLLDCVEQTISK